MSWDVILPFLKPIRHLIEDQTISEIMVNPGPRVFIERRGFLIEVEGVALTEQMLYAAVRAAARVQGDDVSAASPVLDCRFPDGSRVAAVLPPCSVGGTTLTIRKFTAQDFTIADLVAGGTLSAAGAAILTGRIRDRANILISGGTGTGKTTLLNILSDAIPQGDRVVLIEDTSEIRARMPNLVRFEARRAQPGLGAVTIRDLLRASLRHRPDRIIVGEVRGGEAFDLIQALNTGHAGSLSTIHANSAHHALSRLANCVMQNEGLGIPWKAIKGQVADSFDLIAHVERRVFKDPRDGARAEIRRVVHQVLELQGYDPDADRYALAPLYDSGAEEERDARPAA